MIVTAAANEGAQRRAAGGLRRAGLGVGDRVVLCLPPTTDVLAVALGALRSGVVPVMLDAALTAGERAELVADADAALVVDQPATLKTLVDGPAADLADVPLARDALRIGYLRSAQGRLDRRP